MTHTTIPRLITRGAEVYGSLTAVSDGAVQLSYAELADASLTVARALAAHGVRPGDRVAIWAPNSHHWVRAAHGVYTAGATVVPVNTRYRAMEARELLARTQAKAIVVDSGFLNYDYLGALFDVAGDDEVGRAARAGLTVVVDVAAEARTRPGDPDRPPVRTWDDFVADAAQVDPATARAVAEAVGPADLSDIIFTSGTTGRAKGVTVQHGPCVELYQDYGRLWGLRAGERYLVTLPMFHAGGIKAGILTCLLHGLTVVPMAVFDPTAMLEVIQRERIAVLNVPPTIIYGLLDHPERSRYDISSLRTAATGAAVVPVAMVERAQTELPFEHFITAYGMTECYGTATMCRIGDPKEAIANTNGRPLPGVELKVVDPAGRDLPAGEPGEVLIRGVNVMTGYWDTPEQTAEAIRDGWLHSGDIGTLDPAGNLKITDRLKDLYIVGGFNVSPAEVEQLLARHPAVGEVAVIGVPDDRLGEVGRAYVIARRDVAATEDEIIAWCRERIANFKVPRSVVFVDRLPRTPNGKVLKGELRAAVGAGPVAPA
jgi:acyl-CoA synthetase (AMP-forming)/AMP-acid ligase II